MEKKDDIKAILKYTYSKYHIVILGVGLKSLIKGIWSGVKS